MDLSASEVLIIAPHPDDEVLGCGGTIAKHVKDKDRVSLCLVTEVYRPDWSKQFLKKRPREIKKASQILGIKKTYFLDFPTAKLDTFPQKELNEAILKVVKKVQPEIVYLPHQGDLSKDHRLVFEAGLVALRPIDYKIKRILSYEVLSETEWGQPLKPFSPDVYIDISATLKKKIAAMKAYQSELKQPCHPRSLELIEALAKKRGSEVKVKFAEAFKLIREVI
jgi:LmbE family N-acetylglucosaminyl deacetylase